MSLTHEDETRSFLGDPLNDYCAECLCSWFYVDYECTCDCHDWESDDFDDEED